MEVPELPGCMADGETYQKALPMVKMRSGCGSKPLVNSLMRLQSPEVGESMHDMPSADARNRASNGELRPHGPDAV